MIETKTGLPLNINDDLQITNFNDLLITVKQIDRYYSSLAVDPKDARKIRTKLNRLNRKLNRRRINIKKSYMEPYNDLKNQVKTLQSYIKEASNAFNDEINAEQKRRKQKRVAKLQRDMDEVCEYHHVGWLPVPKECLKTNLNNKERFQLMVDYVDDVIKRTKLKGCQVVGDKVVDINGEIMANVTGKRLSFIGSKEQLKALKAFAKKNHIVLNF